MPVFPHSHSPRTLYHATRLLPPRTRLDSKIAAVNLPWTRSKISIGPTSAASDVVE